MGFAMLIEKKGLVPVSLQNSKTIAVVDDQPEMRQLLRDFLTTQGYRVECFSSSTGAIKALENQNGHPRFAAIVSDVNMGGGMNGMDLLKSIKEEHPDLPVLLITAHSTKFQADEAKKAGAYDYLTKPFPLSRLANALQSVLHGISNH